MLVFREGYTLITNWALSNPKVFFFGLTKNLFSGSPTLLRLENVTKWPDLWNFSVLRAFPGGKGDDFGCCRNPPNPKKWPKRKQFFWVVATQTFLEVSSLILGRWFNLTIIFFRWVGSTTNYFLLFSRMFYQMLLASTSSDPRVTWKPFPAVYPELGGGKFTKKLPETNSNFSPLYHAPAVWPPKKGSQKIVSEKHRFFPRVNSLF